MTAVSALYNEMQQEIDGLLQQLKEQKEQMRQKDETIDELTRRITGRNTEMEELRRLRTEIIDKKRRKSLIILQQRQ